MVWFGFVEMMVVLLGFVLPALLVVALILVVRKNQRSATGLLPAPVPSHQERAAHLRHQRDRYQAERSRILGMVSAGTISAEEADRLLETLERETTTMDCPLCGVEIRAEAVKCPHCRQFLTEDAHRPRRLTKSHDKMLAGVCAGVGEYAGVDASIVRLLTVLVVVFSGFVTGLIAYLIAALVLPEKEWPAEHA